MLTVQQAAEQIGVSGSLIYEWCHAGLLPHYRFGRPGRRGKVMIDSDELAAFVAGCHRDGAEDNEPLKHIR
jgi:excisionase family DNA binding protein